MNIAFGGKLYQDIYSQTKNPIKHNQQLPKRYPSHTARLANNSLIKDIMGSSDIMVNSLHHQAISVLGDDFNVTAEAPDGIIEAIEHTRLSFCLGVQWHPEHMAEHYKIFEIFIRFSKDTKAGGI